MVKINNIFLGVNSEESEVYLRLLMELRISLENIFLDFVDFLYQFKEINSEKLGEELEYLNFLCLRYHKLPLKIKISSEKKNQKIDSICEILQKTRKAFDYCLLDFIDFYHKNPKIIRKLKINKSLAIILKKKSIEYYKLLPDKFLKVPRETLILQKNTKRKKEKIQLSNFVEKISEVLDREFLKVYDYLIETKFKKINCPAIYSLLGDFERIERKYHKIKFKIKIVNKKPLKAEEFFLEETGKNLIRLKNLKKSICE